MLTNPVGEKLNYALAFKFHASNEEVEYEYLLAGLEFASVVKEKNLHLRYDSLLIVNQVIEKYSAREENKIAYLATVYKLLE